MLLSAGAPPLDVSFPARVNTTKSDSDRRSADYLAADAQSIRELAIGWEGTRKRHGSGTQRLARRRRIVSSRAWSFPRPRTRTVI